MPTSRDDLFTAACASALLLLTACAGNRNPPINASVITSPAAAAAHLKCTDGSEQRGVTPTTFRVRLDATPCALTLSKAGYAAKQETVTADLLLRNRSARYDPLARQPVRKWERSMSVFGAVLQLLGEGIKWLGNVISRALDSPAHVPDPQLHYQLQPE